MTAVLGVAILFTRWLVLPHSPTDDRFIMLALNEQLATQYHSCVPLGWAPVASAGTYYPGYSALVADENILWISDVKRSDLKRRDVQDVLSVLNELVRVGMLTVDRDTTSYHYYLTPSAMRYYYGGNQYGNNPDHYPYLCYSSIAPKQIVYKSAIDHGRTESFGVRFTWQPKVIAPWAKSTILIKHSVTLRPDDMVLSARFVDQRLGWQVETLGSEDTNRFPRLQQCGAWHQGCLCRRQCVVSM